MKKTLYALLLCVLSAVTAAAQVTIVGTKVLDGSGNLLAGGSWCVGSTCFAVTNGSIAFGSSISTPVTATITVASGGLTYLTVPAVTVTGSIFNWDIFRLGASTTASGIGQPRIACMPGAGYNQTDSGYSWSCQSINGSAQWQQGAPTGNMTAGPPLLVTGGSMFGPLILFHDPTQQLEAVTLHYLQAQLAGLTGGGGTVTFSGSTTVAASTNGTLTNLHAICADALHNVIDCGAVPILTTGGSFTVLPTLPSTTPSGLQPTSQTYLAAQLGLYLPLTGGTLSGTVTSSDGSLLASQNYVTAAVAAGGGSGGAGFTGGQLLTPIYGSEDAVGPTELTTLQQITAAIAAAGALEVNKSGDSMSGTLLLSDASPAASQAYVIAAVAGGGGGGGGIAQFPLQQVSGNLSIVNSALACADNSICQGAIDSNGFSNFVTATSTVITVTGAVTPLVLNDANGICRFNGTQTITPSVAGPHYVYASYTIDATSAVCTMTLIDTTVVGWAWHETSTPTATGTGTNTQYGFDQDLYGWRSNTGGAWSGVLATQVVPLFDYVFASGAIELLGPMPYGLSEGMITGVFGGGTNGQLFISSGTTTDNGCMDYASVIMDGTATLLTSRASSVIASTGLCVRAQWPILLAGTASMTTVGLGFPGPAGSSTALAGGTQGGYGGAGGCGGSSGAGALQQAHASGGRLNWIAPGNPTGFCLAGGTTVGEAATATWTGNAVAPPGLVFSGSGGTGSNGCTDGTNVGGAGGASGGPLYVATPFLVLGTTSSIKSDGQQPPTPVAGIVCGGGGGGAGNSEIRALGWRFGTSQVTQYTANGGLGGIHFGTGGVDGVAGGAGVTSLKRAY